MEALFFLAPLAVVLLVVLIVRWQRSRVFGVGRLSYIDPSRTVPFGGDIVKSFYVLQKAGITSGPAAASAMVLKLVRLGLLSVAKDEKGRTCLVVADSGDTSGLYQSELDLLRMLKRKDFHKWVTTHTRVVAQWVGEVSRDGARALIAEGSMDKKGHFTPAGTVRACDVAAYRRYLKDTGIDEDKSMDKTVKDSMVFGALFSCMKQLKRTYGNDNNWPEAYEMLNEAGRVARSVGIAVNGQSNSRNYSDYNGG